MENAIAQEFNTKGLIKFVIPSVVMMVFVSIYSMMGGVLASNFIGESALSAINIVFPFVSLALAVAIMFATGSTAIVAANLGENKPQVARENLTTITIVAFIVGLLFMIFAKVFDDEIIRFLGATESIIPFAKVHLNAYAFAIPLLFISILSQYYFVTAGKSLMGMFVVIGSGITNMVVSFLAIAVFKIGIAGVGLGLFCAYLVPATTYMYFFLSKKSNFLYFVKPKLHKGFLLNTCANGSSEMVTNLAIAIVSAVMNIIMGSLMGDTGIAAVSVISQVQFFLNSMYIGFGAGVAPIFGYAYGAENHKQTKKVFKISVILTGISSLCLVVLCLVFNDVVVSMFINPNSPSYELAKTGFTIFSLGYIFAGLNIFASVFFTSVSNGKISALISFLRTFLFILGMLIILPPLLGTNGVWLAIPIAELLAIIVSFILLKRYRKVYHY